MNEPTDLESLARRDAQNRVLYLAQRMWRIQLSLCDGDHQRAAVLLDQAVRLAEPKAR